MASTLPTASPSGREWEQTRNRSPSRMVCRMASIGFGGELAAMLAVGGIGEGGVNHGGYSTDAFCRLRERS